MKLKRTFWLLLCLLATVPAAAQIGSWRTHTTFRQVKSVTASPGQVWAATTGGLFGVSYETGEIRSFTVVEGLHDISLSEVLFDSDCGKKGCLWIGYPDGAIDRFDLETEAVRTIWDIARASRYPSRQVNRLSLGSGVLYVGTSFGLVVLDRERMEVRDTYDQFGTLQWGTAAYDALEATDPDGVPTLWVATAGGLAHAPLAAPNLRDPASWKIEIPWITPFLALGSFQNGIYGGIPGALVRRTPDGQFEQISATTGNVTRLVTGANRLLAIDRTGIIRYDGEAHRTGLQGATQLSGLAIAGGKLWAGDSETGLLRYPDTLPGGELAPEQTLLPPGPRFGIFEDLVVASNGDLWAAGVYAAFTGFHRLQPSGEWTDYTRETVSTLGDWGGFTRIAVSATGDVWSGSQGNGLAHVAPDNTVTVFNHTNATFDVRPGYAVTPATDRDGTVWVTTKGAPLPLHVRTPAGKWVGFPIHDCDGLGVAFGTYDRIFIDSYGQKWITVVSRANFSRTIGLLVLNTGKSVEDASDDKCRFLSTEGADGQGLPNVAVTSVDEGPDHTIWIGTIDGPAYVNNNAIMAEDKSWQPLWPVNEGGAAYALEGLQINDLAVDPGRGVWFATNEGVWQLQGKEGLYRVAAHHTMDDSPLLSDRVISVAIEEQSGRVYFSTDRGLVSVGAVAAGAAEGKRNLFVFPNPVRLASGDPEEVFIEGLVAETTVSIVTIDGRLVSRFDASGGRVRWDLRDTEGRPVPSGMYLVVAVGKDGEGAAYGKLAVVR